MANILVLLLVLTAGFVTTHFLLDRIKQRYLLAGGLEYMLLGLMAGPAMGVVYGHVLAWFEGGPATPWS